MLLIVDEVSGIAFSNGYQREHIDIRLPHARHSDYIFYTQFSNFTFMTFNVISLLDSHWIEYSPMLTVYMGLQPMTLKFRNAIETGLPHLERIRMLAHRGFNETLYKNLGQLV